MDLDLRSNFSFDSNAISLRISWDFHNFQSAFVVAFHYFSHHLQLQSHVWDARFLFAPEPSHVFQLPTVRHSRRQIPISWPPGRVLATPGLINTECYSLWNSRSTWTRQCLAPHRVNSDWIYLDRYSRVTSLYQRTSTVQCYNTLENWLQGLISGTRIKRAGRCAIAASAYRRHPACGNTKQSFELLRHLKLNPEKDFSSPKIDFVSA